jgi:hypothetical protein
MTPTLTPKKYVSKMDRMRYVEAFCLTLESVMRHLQKEEILPWGLEIDRSYQDPEGQHVRLQSYWTAPVLANNPLDVRVGHWVTLHSNGRIYYCTSSDFTIYEPAPEPAETQETTCYAVPHFWLELRQLLGAIETAGRAELLLAVRNMRDERDASKTSYENMKNVFEKECSNYHEAERRARAQRDEARRERDALEGRLAMMTENAHEEHDECASDWTFTAQRKKSLQQHIEHAVDQWARTYGM